MLSTFRTQTSRLLRRTGPSQGSLPRRTADAIFDAWTHELMFVATDGTSVASRVQVAATFTKRFRGLLARETLAPEEGLLLTPGGSIHTIGMRFAIDVLFLDRHMRVLKCAEAVMPLRFVFAPERTHYVLELCTGRISAANIRAGMRLLWSEVARDQ